MTTNDTLLRFIFSNLPIRGSSVRMDEAWKQMHANHKLPAPVMKLLGEMTAGATLLASGLKFEGSVIMHLQGDGPVRLAVVEVKNGLGIRATAKIHDGAIIHDTMTTKDLINRHGHGRCAIMLDPKDRREGEPLYQGVVPLVGESIADGLMNYMHQSEQLDTRLWLKGDAEHVGGMMIQKMPGFGGKDEHLIDDPDAWERILTLAETIKDEELLGLDAKEIEHRLFWQEDVQLLAEQTPTFQCSCSRERIEHMIRNLGEVEALQAAEEAGALEVVCDFCGQVYRYTPQEVVGLFQTGDETQH